jgi:N-acetylglucosaminyldiphosphoundecaprenol N-acetyl-beta-D-mannosaminyltransferase
MKSYKLLGISLEKQTKEAVLEKIKKAILSAKETLHIISINPENAVIFQTNKLFQEVVNTSQIHIIDGVGVKYACQFLGIKIGDKIAGVDLMLDMIKLADSMRLRVLFIGGRQKIALQLAECYSKKYPKAKFFGFEAIQNIKNPSKFEGKTLFSIVRDVKPHMIFAAFGSPEQELFFYRYRNEFQGSVCMGVGGAFDYLSGNIKRAPIFLQQLGLEWFYRLVTQPWRWRRQLRLLKFAGLIILQKFKIVVLHFDI